MRPSLPTISVFVFWRWHVTVWFLKLIVVARDHPLRGSDNYSATSNNMKLVHWPLMGGLLHLVQRGRNWAGPSSPRPLLAVPNVTAYPSTANVPIVVFLYNGPFLCGFNVPIKGLTYSLSLGPVLLAIGWPAYRVVGWPLAPVSKTAWLSVNDSSALCWPCDLDLWPQIDPIIRDTAHPSVSVELTRGFRSWLRVRHGTDGRTDR